MNKRRIIATITFVLGFLIAGWLWAEDHHLAAAGVLLIPAAWNLFSVGSSRKEIEEPELLRDVPNSSAEEVKRYREAHPGASMHEAIALLKHEQNPLERTSASNMSSMST